MLESKGSNRIIKLEGLERRRVSNRRLCTCSGARSSSANGYDCHPTCVGIRMINF